MSIMAEGQMQQLLLILLLSLVLHTSGCLAAVKSALLVVDMQGCFLPGGPLAVSGDVRPVLDAINTLKQHGDFQLVVWTQDWHPPNHVSFAAVHGKQPQETLPLFYTCVGNRWMGKGPRLCNMTQLYSQPTESVTCIDYDTSDSWWHSGDVSAGSAGLHWGGEGSQPQTGSGSTGSSGWHESNSSSPAGRGGGHVVQDISEGVHNMSAAAAALAERISKFGCPEPVTEVTQRLWPSHCVRYTADARIHPDLLVSPHDFVVRKGWQPFLDAYSAFEDNGKLQSTGLAQQLRQEGIGRVVVTGVALDYCVLYTALDAVAEGFETVLARDATLPVTAAGGADAVLKLHRAGVQIVDSQSLLLPNTTAEW